MRNVVGHLLVLALLVGCTREGADLSQSAPSESTTVQATAPAPQQRVELNEYSVRMTPTLTAGAQAFSIVNSGKETHSFEIEGNDVHARLPADLPRGETATLEVSLKPGTYTVYCPVEGHKEKGMSTTVTVR